MPEELSQLISRAMLRDQHGFLRRYEAIRRRGGHFVGQDELRRQIEESVRRRDDRLRARPAIWYPEELPISAKRDEIKAAINTSQVVIVCGETGSGKTTQLPKICLEMGRGIGALIGHTQPRRIAARSVAARIAEELNTRVSEQVAFKIRFFDNVSDKTFIKVMTDGTLLAETQNDRLLQAYDTIILDEAHERSLNIDFLLGYLKQLLPKRPDLKLIITSATIDPGSFSKHFDDAPIVMVSGRMYPLEVRYRDPHAPAMVEVDEAGAQSVTEEVDEEEPDLMQSIVEAVQEIVSGGSVSAAADSTATTGAAPAAVAAPGAGDILVFLSGEREIREATFELEAALKRADVELLPLYARLSTEDQQRIFLPSKKRRIILATNVAETSLTVPGIRFVIDSGLARISRYNPKSKVQRLPIEPISQASANQRSGRCGRVAAGVAIRLYSESSFASRPEFTEPEILRTNLAAVILQMKLLNLGPVEEFPFLEKPNARLIADGYQTLLELGAINKVGNDQPLTALGAKLARLPIDPRIARMVLAGQDEGVERDVLVIAAALSVQDPRERPLDQQQAADTAHLEFRDGDSDFLGYLKLWDWYHKEARALSSSKLRKACKERFLSYTRMREWHDIHEQLAEVLAEFREEDRAAQAPPNPRAPVGNQPAVHRPPAPRAGGPGAPSPVTTPSNRPLPNIPRRRL